MDRIIEVGLELFKFIKEKGIADEFLDWLADKAADTESPIDDFAIRIIRYLIQ